MTFKLSKEDLLRVDMLKNLTANQITTIEEANQALETINQTIKYFQERYGYNPLEEKQGD